MPVDTASPAANDATDAAAITAGLMAVRNPGYLGAAIRSFIEGRDRPRRR